MKKLVIIFAAFFMFCQQEPNPITEKVNNFDTEFLCYKEFVLAISDDSTNVNDRQVLLDSLLTHHNLTNDDFTDFVKYIKNNPKIFADSLKRFNKELY